jgi:hypothetical protein
MHDTQDAQDPASLIGGELALPLHIPQDLIDVPTSCDQLSAHATESSDCAR